MAGGTEIIISPEGITVKTAGYAKFFASEHVFENGASQSFQLPILPEAFGHNLKFLCTDDDGLPYKNIPYTAVYPSGAEVKGVTDEEGYTEEFNSGDKKDIKIQLELD